MRLALPSLMLLVLLVTGCGLLADSVTGLWQTPNNAAPVDLGKLLTDYKSPVSGHLQLVLQQYQEDVAGNLRIYSNPKETSTDYWWHPPDSLIADCGCLYVEEATSRSGTLRLVATFAGEGEGEPMAESVHATLQLNSSEDPELLEGYFHLPEVDCFEKPETDNCIPVTFELKNDSHIREKSMDEGCSIGACK